MCIAIVKPRGVKMPDRELLHNCFISNPHGAGFAYHRDGLTHIVKGLMTFESFFHELNSHNLSDEENVFLHFRIATHGLRDGGNTHPFPITEDFELMRKTNYEYKGHCLIHNGVFHYTDDLMKFYDPRGIISDTMLFSKIVAEEYNSVLFVPSRLTNVSFETAIAFELKDVNNRKNQNLNKIIDEDMLFSKVAIMDEKGEFIKFGEWINYNGVFYSNYGFSGYGNYKKVNITTYSPKSKKYYDDDLLPSERFHCGTLYGKKRKRRKERCDFCNKFKKNYNILDDGEVICSECESILMCNICKGCNQEFSDEEMANDEYCVKCFCENEPQVCISCGQNYAKKDESKEPEVCKKCYDSFIKNAIV